jgi:hypothetical protein
MIQTRSALVGWMVLNLAASGSTATMQERTIIDTVVVGDISASTLRAALEVLPRRPKRIDIVDDRDLPAVTAKQIREMDAFVPVGSQTICLRRQSRALRAAESAGGPDTLVLALVIWHEMAHVEGLDERGARQREEELWMEFIRNNRVDGGFGMAYLRELQARK